MPRTNPTHRAALAKMLADAVPGLGRQKALEQVTAAAEAGLFPTRLDAAGRQQALQVLLTASPDRLHPNTLLTGLTVMSGPHTTKVYTDEKATRLGNPTCDVCRRRLRDNEKWWLVEDTTGRRGWDSNAGVACSLHHPERLPDHRWPTPAAEVSLRWRLGGDYTTRIHNGTLTGQYNLDDVTCDVCTRALALDEPWWLVATDEATWRNNAARTVCADHQPGRLNPMPHPLHINASQCPCTSPASTGFRQPNPDCPDHGDLTGVETLPDRRYCHSTVTRGARADICLLPADHVHTWGVLDHVGHQFGWRWLAACPEPVEDIRGLCGNIITPGETSCGAHIHRGTYFLQAGPNPAPVWSATGQDLFPDCAIDGRPFAPGEPVYTVTSTAHGWDNNRAGVCWRHHPDTPVDLTAARTACPYCRTQGHGPATDNMVCECGTFCGSLHCTLRPATATR